MKKFLIASVALTMASAANAPALQAQGGVESAIHLLYAANDTVQGAIERDHCGEEQTLTERARLNGIDAKAYDAIDRALFRAYGATNGTDSALEAVQSEFCDAVSNR